jgi:hypothetical protein
MGGSEVVVTVDVEWAHPDVLADVVAQLDERGLQATFFCTHEGIEVPGHERALHPSFRRQGNTQLGAEAERLSDRQLYGAVVERMSALYPEARGVRAHSLFHDSDLLPVFRAAGLEYDSSYMLPLAPGLAPVWKGAGILELPLYYMDHWDLREQATGFALAGLRLGSPGLKVVAFHPNLVYLNASQPEHYERAREHYHDPPWLRTARRGGRGARTLFLELLDSLAERERPPVLSDLNERWRAANRTAEHDAA